MVVTRFAPSPTGYLHVGGARTALFNWLWARKTGGQFILRIEDTDIKRNTPTATRQVINDLRWLGIDWDQGPEVGGPNGPYLQSRRKDIYDKYIKQLINEKKAYYCFDTPDQLQVLRDRAAAEKKNFKYPRPEHFPDESDANSAKADGLPVTVRLGFPTYHFACVVDDELMEVTHVIRGQEHLMNTPGHQALQDALAFRRPIYAHMSVTVSATGGKLSKRERPKALWKAIKDKADINLEKLAEAAGIGAEELNTFLKNKTWPDMSVVDAMARHLGLRLPEINVVDFFRSGYLPETMVNFLALLGYSPGDNREIMSLEELIETFDIRRLTKSNSLFDRGKLLAFNTEHLRLIGSEKLLRHFQDYLEAVESPLISADEKLLARILEINAGAKTLADIEQKSKFIFLSNEQIEYDEKAVARVLLKNDGLAVLRVVRDRLAAMEEFTEDNIESMLRGLAEERRLGLGKVAQPLRVAICGTTVSPPIFDSVNLLGKENTLARVDRAMRKFGCANQ